MSLGGACDLARRLDDVFDGLLSASKLVVLITIVLYIAHIIGCLWFWVVRGRPLPAQLLCSAPRSSQLLLSSVFERFRAP
jgi:Na+/serine symporter